MARFRHIPSLVEATPGVDGDGKPEWTVSWPDGRVTHYTPQDFRDKFMPDSVDARQLFANMFGDYGWGYDRLYKENQDPKPLTTLAGKEVALAIAAKTFQFGCGHCRFDAPLIVPDHKEHAVTCTNCNQVSWVHVDPEDGTLWSNPERTMPLSQIGPELILEPEPGLVDKTTGDAAQAEIKPGYFINVNGEYVKEVWEPTYDPEIEYNLNPPRLRWANTKKEITEEELSKMHKGFFAMHTLPPIAGGPKSST